MIESLINFVKANQALTFLFGGSLTASLLYALKAVPGKIKKFFFWRFTSCVMVSNDDRAFSMISEWLGTQKFSKQARHTRIESSTNVHENGDVLRQSPGLGFYWFWFNSKIVLLSRTNPGGAPDKYGRPVESIVLRTFGSSPATLQALLDKVSSSRNKDCDHVEVFLFKGYWSAVCRKTKRSLESVVLPEIQKQRIINDITWFQGAYEWYKKQGIPYRRGLLLTGVPGTGKTSLVFTLAGYLGMRIYAINLGSIKGDSSLIEAMTGVPENSILLIEDIDAAQTDRESGEKADDEKITLSGLLNAIDGVFSRDGRVLIMTSNHPEKLDKALLRPGRADLIEELGPLQQPEVITMCKQFLDDRGEAFAKTVECPITPAELQKKLIAQLSPVVPS